MSLDLDVTPETLGPSTSRRPTSRSIRWQRTWAGHVRTFGPLRLQGVADTESDTEHYAVVPLPDLDSSKMYLWIVEADRLKLGTRRFAIGVVRQGYTYDGGDVFASTGVGAADLTLDADAIVDVSGGVFGQIGNPDYKFLFNRSELTVSSGRPAAPELRIIVVLHGAVAGEADDDAEIYVHLVEFDLAPADITEVTP